MKTFMRMAVLGALLAAGGVQAQQATMAPADIAQIKTDVKAAMAGYISAFNHKDAKAIADASSTSPSVTIGANGVGTDTPEEVVTRYAGNIANLEKTGWARSEISDPTVCVMNANVAFADVQLTRWKADGSVLSRGATIYILNKGKDGKWRIATFTGHDPAKKATCSD